MELQALLKIAFDKRASDLHLMPLIPPLLRIDGDLTVIEGFPPFSSDETKQLIYSILTTEQQIAFEQDKTLDLAISYPHIGQFRVSVLRQIHGIGAVFRLVPEAIPTFETLALPIVLKRLLSLPHGLILITGPTGSGKTSTLAAMVDYINQTRASHIMTIEEPIEFIHRSNKSSITQLEIGRDAKTASMALRSSLRQDPDIIMLGEMRDIETIRLALTAAETGHLVLATLHANSSPLAISRIIDVFSAEEKPRIRNLLSETIEAVICQTLVKRVTGGRIAAFEIMLATPSIRHYIYQDMIAQMESTVQTSGDIGMCTLAQYLQELVAKGEVNAGIARSITLNRESFRSTELIKKKK